jgi:hypothetical protein
MIPNYMAKQSKSKLQQLLYAWQEMKLKLYYFYSNLYSSVDIISGMSRSTF